MRFEKIVGAKGNECTLFGAVPPFEHLNYCRGEIIIADSARYYFKSLECLPLPFEKSFLPLGGKRHDKWLP